MIWDKQGGFHTALCAVLAALQIRSGVRTAGRQIIPHDYMVSGANINTITPSHYHTRQQAAAGSRQQAASSSQRI